MKGCTCRGRTLSTSVARLGPHGRGVDAPPPAGHLRESVYAGHCAPGQGAPVAGLSHPRQPQSLPGYPDLTLAKPGKPLLLSELKVPGGR